MFMALAFVQRAPRVVSLTKRIDIYSMDGRRGHRACAVKRRIDQRPHMGVCRRFLDDYAQPRL